MPDPVSVKLLGTEAPGLLANQRTYNGAPELSMTYKLGPEECIRGFKGSNIDQYRIFESANLCVPYWHAEYVV